MTSWEAIQIINDSDWPSNVKNLVRALLQWRNARTGLAFPSIAQISRALSVSESTARSYVNQAIESGALVVETGRDGGRLTNRYRVVLPEASPEEAGGVDCPATPASDAPLSGVRDPVRPDLMPTPPESGAHPTEIRCPPHRNPVPTPPDSGPVPSINPAKDLQQQVVAEADVFDRLGIPNLRGHANATTDRMAWIARVAPSKSNPSGWAAQCIREGWKVPPPSPAQNAQAQAAARDAYLATFDTMSKPEQEKILAQVRREFDNLSNRADDDRAVRAAIARVMERHG